MEAIGTIALRIGCTLHTLWRWARQAERDAGRREGTTTSGRELIKELEADGWALDRIKGSHHYFRHPTKPGTITVPHPKKDPGFIE